MLWDSSESIEVFSPFCPDDCASRLDAAIDSEWKFFGSKPVIGRASESSLRLRKRIFYNNSFQSILVATMRPEQRGTIISGTCGMRPVVRIGMLIWFAGVILIGLPVAFSMLRTHDSMGVAIPVGLLVFGFALIKFGRYLARNETRFLKDFLIQTLNGYSRPASTLLRHEISNTPT